MYYIGICDDEEMQRKRIRKMCDTFFKSRIQEYECIEFSSGEEVLQFHEKKLHLLFLDIELGEMDGLSVLRRVERADAIWRIVFVSNHAEMVWNSFSLKTLDFGRKPISFKQVEKWLSIVLHENEENIIYEFQEGDKKYYVPLDEILYFEAIGNFTYLYKNDIRILLGGHLKLWQERMGDTYFVRIHKSYLVNICNIKKVCSEKIILTDGTELLAGRKYYKTAKEQYLLFLQKKARERVI